MTPNVLLPTEKFPENLSSIEPSISHLFPALQQNQILFPSHSLVTSPLLFSLKNLSMFPPTEDMSPLTEEEYKISLPFSLPQTPPQPFLTNTLTQTHRDQITHRENPPNKIRDHTSLGLSPSLLWTDLNQARPAPQRKRVTPLMEFGRPQMPPLTTLITSHPDPRELASQILRHSHARDYKTRAASLFLDFLHTTDNTTTMEERVVIWASKRLQTASATTVSNYISMISAIIASETGIEVTKTPMVRGFSRAIRRLQGDHRFKTTPPMDQMEMKELIENVPPPLNAIILLAWRRAGRVRDILETREGGLWRAQGGLTETHMATDFTLLILEESFDKVSWAGLSDHTPLLIENPLMHILLPFISKHPPTTPPRSRPLMFPRITTDQITHIIKTIHPHLSSRSIRRGALQTLIQKGFTLNECRMLSHHHSLEGLMRYLETTDQTSQETLLMMQGAL